MSDETRGHAVKRRRQLLGIKSQHQLARVSRDLKMEVSRDAIMAAEKGEASPSTYDRIEALLDKVAALDVPLEDVEDDDTNEVIDPTSGLVEIRASGNFGVDIIVKGPVANLPELKAAVADLIRETRADEK